MLDICIRGQMKKLGNICFTVAKKQFRLLDPNSSVDDVNSLQFNRFQGLFDLLICRPNNEVFPSRWKLSNDATITFQIINHSNVKSSNKYGK